MRKLNEIEEKKNESREVYMTKNNEDLEDET